MTDASKRTRTRVAVGITILWGVGYLVAIWKREAALAAAATPLALLAVGYLLGGPWRKGEKDE